MSRREVSRSTALLGVLAVLAGPARSFGAQERAAPSKPPAQAEQISENVYRIGRVIVDLKARTVTCQGKVNLQKGLVEYLAVAQRGKVHESVLELDAQPLHVQLGLILLGLAPQGGLEFQGDPKPPKGPPVEIWVVWERGVREVRVRGEEMVWDTGRKRPMEANAWVFSGSRVTARGFEGDRERSIIATYRDPAAIVNNRLPGGADDTLYEVNTRLVPRRGTAVQLIIQAPKPPDPMP